MNVSKTKQIKKDYIWNTLGSTMNALSSVVLLMVVTQSMGVYMGGVFAIAFAVAQQFLVLGHFEIRPYQATDVQENFSFGIYYAARITTCILMFVCIVGYTIFSNGFTHDGLLLLLVASLKFFDAFEDVFHGMFQQHGRLDIAGKAFFFRVLVTTVVFVAIAFIFKDLAVVCITTFVASLVAMVFLNIPKAKDFVPIKPVFQWKKIKNLIITCLPLFIGSFLLAYIVNAPRYGIETCLPKEAQAIYAALFMPAMVINLLSGFIFKPLLTTLAEYWNADKISHFNGVIGKGVAVVLGVSLACFIGAFFVGIPILSWFYGVDLAGYRPELMVLLVGGACNAVGIIFYYALVTMRCQRVLVVGYGCAAIIAFLINGFMVQNQGIMGAAITYDATMAVLAFVFLGFVLYYLPRSNKVKSVEGK